jgi:hypothetical protein
MSNSPPQRSRSTSNSSQQNNALRSQTSQSLRNQGSMTLKKSNTLRSQQSGSAPKVIGHADSKTYFEEEVTVDKELSIQQSLIFRNDPNRSPPGSMRSNSNAADFPNDLSAGTHSSEFRSPVGSMSRSDSSPAPPNEKKVTIADKKAAGDRPDIYNAQSSVYSRASSGGDKLVDLEPLQAGTLVLLKFSRLGEPLERVFKLSEDNRYLTYNSSFFAFKALTNKRIDMESVKRVLKGQVSPRFQELKAAATYPGASSRSFSIIYGENDMSLDLIAPSVEDFRLWYKGLSKVVSDIAFSREYTKLDVLYLKNQFESADKDKSNSLSKKEVLKLLDHINVSMTTAAIDVIFRKVDTDESGELSFDEFSNFVQLLRRRHDIEFLWELLVTKSFFDEKIQHCQNFGIAKKSNKKDVVTGLVPSLIPHSVLTESISVNDFQNFWSLFQGSRLTDAEAKTMILAVMPVIDSKSGAPVLLSYAGFLQIMMSQSNDAYSSSSKKRDADNLQEPLSSYYIASSHNTYLSGDQVTGVSSVDRYVSVILQGCRCVEFDLWDGDAGPIITHGHTLTSKISFTEVIRALKEAAFAANAKGEVNEMPVILSMENHCSWEYQKMVADILKHELGTLLQKPGVGIKDGRLPAPADMKRKFILKGKMSASETEVSDDEDASPSNALAVASSDGDVALGGDAPAIKEPKKRPGTHPDLSGLIFLGTEPVRDFANSDSIACDVMSSYSEGKTRNLAKKDVTASAWINHNMTHLSRTYPKNLRIDSSNMDPMDSWSVGAQMAAMNYQTSGTPMFLNHGKFLQNANCGYVLKPFYMRSPGATHLGERIIKVHVFGGHQLPKPGSVAFGEVIDPYVMVSINGVATDNVEHRTKTVDNNGFNPIWDEVFTFTVSNPECAQLLFRVYDADLDRDDFVAFSAIPVSNLLEGFRNVSLYDSGGSRQGDMMFASLSIRVKVVTK